MDFRVLGALTVTDEQGVVTIRRRKCQALLALLLSHHPHALSIDAVAEALWPDADPGKALNSVRVHATYLRRALGAHADLLPRTAGGYRLAVDRADIDATRFEDRIAMARDAAAAGDAHRATDEFALALGTWGGDPYREFPEVDALRDERSRLVRVWLDALEGYATVLLDDDRADEACRVLMPVVDDHLHHETLVARLMLGLHRTGRQHEALNLFSRVKDELDPRGMVPTPQLQELANAILLHDTTLDAARAAPAQSRRVIPPRRRAEFIGRGDELRSLTELWTAATHGTPQLAHIYGEAGLGKTTLLRRLADQIVDDGGIVVLGGCEPDPVENFQPFPHLVRRVLRDDPPADSLPSMLSELARLAPDLRDQLPDLREPPEPGAGRQRLFTAVGELVAAPTRPRLLVVEDLHWARPDTMMLLHHVVRQARGQLMIVLTYRRQEHDAPHTYGTAAMSGRLTKPDLGIGLRPMDNHEVRALIDALAPNERREEWISQLRELVSVSAGNPMRVREVLRQLELEPDVPVSEIVPEDVRGLVTRRLRSLAPEARVVIQTASVLGRVFTLGEIVAASDLGEATVLDSLEDSMGQGLVIEGSRTDDFAFAHPTFRNGVYYSLARSRRARIHLRCGEAIGADATDAPGDRRRSEAARHFVAARPVSDARRTALLARRAGDDATRRYAHDDAVDWYRHAVKAAVDGAMPLVDLARLRLALGTELELSGDLATARVEYFAVADIARAIPDLTLLADAAVAATPRESILDRDFALRLNALVDEVLAALPPDDETRIRLLHSAALGRVYADADAVGPIAAESERLARSSTDPQSQHWNLVTRYLATDPEDNPARLAVSRDIREHTIRHQLEGEMGGASRRFLVELLVRGALEEFDAELATMTQMARTTSIPDDRYWAAAFLATRSLMQDAGSTTEELIKGAALIGIQQQVGSGAGMQMLQTFALRYQQQRLHEVASGLVAPPSSSPQIQAGTSLLAIALAEIGAADDARSILDRVVVRGEIMLPHDNFRTAAIALFAGAAAGCGTPKQRKAFRNALEPRADQFCVFGAGGAVFGTNHHWLARLAAADGDDEAALGHLSRAAELCRAAVATHWATVAEEEQLQLTATFDGVERR